MLKLIKRKKGKYFFVKLFVCEKVAHPPALFLSNATVRFPDALPLSFVRSETIAPDAALTAQRTSVRVLQHLAQCAGGALGTHAGAVLSNVAQVFARVRRQAALSHPLACHRTHRSWIIQKYQCLRPIIAYIWSVLGTHTILRKKNNYFNDDLIAKCIWF